jgi:uroporphyrinogen III methyltransferase/synthase
MSGEGLPLKGKVIGVTRAREQAAELAELLEECGAKVLFIPTVEFAKVGNECALRPIVHCIGEFDWLLLTSPNAARFFCELLAAEGVSLRGAGFPQVAAVGSATAQAARTAGMTVHHVATSHQGSELVKELETELAGKRVLLPRSDRASGDVPEALRRIGAEVCVVTVYLTRMPDDSANVLRALEDSPPDVIVFASPSAFYHFAQMVGEEVMRTLTVHTEFVSLGPVTSMAIRSCGFPVAAEAREATMEAMRNSVVEFCAAKKVSGARSE